MHPSFKQKGEEMKATKYIQRILGFPFFAGTTFIFVLILWFKYLINYIRFGGETITYTHNNQAKMVADVYEEVKKYIKKQHIQDEKCEHVAPICYNPDAFCSLSECDQPDSCIHHSGRKETK